MISLYVHIPFCERKCLFCSFVVAVGKEHLMDDYVSALAQELILYRDVPLKTIYLGGGTPSYLREPQFERLMDALEKNFIFSNGQEFTLEANPATFTRRQAMRWRQRGVNRISLGIQSFEDKYLRFLGRTHDSRQAREAYALLREAGFSNINVDLMYGFPGQTLDELKNDVRVMTDLKSEHLSLYALTVEPGSRFFARQVALADNHSQAEYYQNVCQQLAASGIEQYEISNFARRDFFSRHNEAYWTGEDYVGVGVGAHSYLVGTRFWNMAHVPTYIGNLRRGQSVREAQDALSPEQRLMEILLIGLRLTRGVDLKALEQRFGFPIPFEKKEKIQEFVRQGFLEFDQTCLKATEQGRLVLDELCVRLI